MLIVDDQKTWPKDIIKQLEKDSVIQLLKSNNFYSNIKDESDICDIVADVKKYASSVGVAVYHCTKQLPERPYKTIGLRILNIERHHSDFLDYICERPEVDKSCFDRIKKALEEWNDREQRYRREDMIYFCIERNLVLDYGTKDFFDYYGGEAIYMPFYNEGMEDIKRILASIGEPVVVEAHLSVSDLETYGQTYGENRFGQSVIECFAESINPDFCIQGLEGYYKKDIPPDKIIEVYPYEKFKEMYS